MITIRRAMLRLHLLPLALPVLANPTVAGAESSYSLAYREAAGCPTRDEFIAELESRSRGLREATDDAPNVGIEVWFGGEEPTNGVLRLRDGDSSPTVRTISGATCREVVRALALTASLLIDGRRQEAHTPAGPAESVLPAPPKDRAATQSPGFLPAPNDRIDEEGAPKFAPDEPPRLRIHVGASVAAELGVLPSTAVAGALEVAAEWGTRHLVHPLLSVAVERTLTETVEQTQGRAVFRWTALRLGLCPLRVPLDGPVRFRPCGFFEGGAIDSKGVDVPGADDARAPWWAAGASGRLELDVVEPLSGLLELGMRLQFRQDRFYFDPDSPQNTIHEVPAAGLFGRVGLQGGF
jgi:hypothetical protein